MKKFILSLFIFALMLPLFVGRIEASSNFVTIAPPKPTTSEEYTLPYPGILPDHPLYLLKVMRDHLVLFLTRDPLARINLKRHLADKRLAMAKLLFEKGKAALAIETMDDAEKFLHEAIDDLFVILRERSDVDESNVDTLNAALTKHGEVLGTVTNVSYNERQAIIKVLNRIRQSKQLLEKFRKGERN